MATKTPLLQSDSSSSEDEPTVKNKPVVVYQRRWTMLAIVTLLTFNIGLQFVFYTAVNRTIQRYFDLPLYTIEYLTISTMITTAVALAPCVWVIHNTSLRTAALVNTSLASIAALVKYFGATLPNNTGYTVTLIGQILSSLASCFALTMPAEFAAAWFSSNQRSTATCIGTTGHFLGFAVAYVLATSLIAGKTDLTSIESGMKSGQIIQFTVSLLLLIAVYVAFETKPPSSPSRSQGMLDIYELRPTYIQSLKLTAKNHQFSIFVVGYGIIFGAMYCQWQVIQEALPEVFKGQEYAIGMLGAVCTVTAIPGAILCGIWLDKTKSYKFSKEVVAFLTVVASVVITVVMHFSGSLVALYIVFALVGMSTSSVISMGFVLASEMTYPVPETISSAVLFISTQILAIVLAAITSFVYEKTENAVTSNVALNVALLLASILVTVGNAEYRRHAEDKN